MKWLTELPYFVPYAAFGLVLFLVAWKVAVPKVQQQVIATQKDLIAALETKVQLLTAQVVELESKLARALSHVDALVSIIEERKTNGHLARIARERRDDRNAAGAEDGTTAA